MKHPRANELTKLIAAVEGAGKTVCAVEVRWEDVDGREVPCWRILTVDAERPKGETKAVEW